MFSSTKPVRFQSDPLASVARWDPLAWPARRRLYHVSELVSFAKEDTCRPAVYVVLSGVMAIRRELSDGRSLLCTLFYGGDIVDLRRSERANQSELVVLQKTRVLLTGSDAFDDCLRVDTDISGMYRAGMQDIAARIRDHMTDVASKTPMERVASVLFEFRRWPQQGVFVDPDLIRLPISRRNIASYLGMKPETVSRVFRRLEQERLLRVNSANQIQLLATSRLRQIANGGWPRGHVS